jgi:HSP20 family protein
MESVRARIPEQEDPMKDLIRFDPFMDLAKWNQPFFDLFEQASKSIALPEGLGAGFQAGIKLDVTEDANAYNVRAEIPGVKKDEIKVNVEGGVVTISAEMKREKEEKKGEKTLRSECFYGAARRSFTLDQPVDEEAVKAKYADGVLTLTLPKKPGGHGRQIAIN